MPQPHETFTEENPFAYKPRGAVVWILFYLTMFGVVFEIVSQYKLSQSYFFLPPEYREVMDKMAPFLYLVWGIRLLSVVGAIRLVMLKKDALYWYVAYWFALSAWNVFALLAYPIFSTPIAWVSAATTFLVTTGVLVYLRMGGIAGRLK